MAFLILLAPSEHKYRIEVGYGLEPILPDGKVGDIGEKPCPHLRQNDYGGALLLVTQRIASVIAQDKGVTLDSLSTAPPAETGSAAITWNPSTIFWLIAILFFVGFPLLGFIVRMLSSEARAATTVDGDLADGLGGPWIGGAMGGFGGGVLAVAASVVEAADLEGLGVGLLVAGAQAAVGNAQQRNLVARQSWRVYGT